MKKKILWLVFGFICVFGFTPNVNASAPATMKTAKLGSSMELISKYKVWNKFNVSNEELYCEVANLAFPGDKTIRLDSEVDKGFVYMINNKPNTTDKNKNYYIMQMAVWWYKDILNNNNNNLDVSFKNYCTNNKNTNDICNRIYNLVEGAKKYKEPRGSISFNTSNVSFRESGSYYISDTITIKTENLATMTNVRLSGAPSGSSIINSTINTASKTGGFQVRVPISSIGSGQSAQFKVEIDATYNTYSAYAYEYGANYQKVIYGKVISKNHPTTTSLTLRVTKDATTVTTTRPATKYNSLTIYKVDQDGDNLRGATLTLYEGNCLNKTCSSRDEYASWTTTRSPKEFTRIPTGYYTLVETDTPDGYETADKAVIYIRYTDEDYNYTMVNVKEGEKKPVLISKTDITGESEVSGATLIIKDSKGKEVANWVSTNSPKQIFLEEGEYTLIEKYAPAGYKLTTTIVYFKVDKHGNVEIKDASGKYVPVDMVTITNESNDLVSISKLDLSTNSFLKGATLVLKNEKGEIIATWTTTDESYDIALPAGYYTITETVAPTGYNLNTNTVYIRVLEDGTLMMKNNQGEYEITSGIIIYNEPVLEEEIITVPKTGLTSVITYSFGTLTLMSGAYLLMKNGQFSL